LLNLSDERWASMEAGYRVPFDLRPLLVRLEADHGVGDAWSDLWQELHHQGDIGVGSLASVPHIVRICTASASIDWNPFALATTIELARGVRGNPDTPDWLRTAYHDALDALSRFGIAQLPHATNEALVRSILALIAAVRGLRSHARLLSQYTDDEILEIENALC
jgi:hypothetical protein